MLYVNSHMYLCNPFLIKYFSILFFYLLNFVLFCTMKLDTFLLYEKITIFKKK